VILALRWTSKRVHVAWRRSEPTCFGSHALGVCVIGVKQTAVTPWGRGPAANQFLSSNGASPLKTPGVGSRFQVITPSPGWRTSPVPPQTASSGSAVAVLSNGRDGRLQGKPPFVERQTKTPFASSNWYAISWL